MRLKLLHLKMIKLATVKDPKVKVAGECIVHPDSDRKLIYSEMKPNMSEEKFNHLLDGDSCVDSAGFRWTCEPVTMFCNGETLRDCL
jgi:hypothetical protein